MDGFIVASLDYPVVVNNVNNNAANSKLAIGKTRLTKEIPRLDSANVCKQHVTKETYEIGRLAQDLAGGLVGSMPSGIDFNEGEMSEDLKKYLKEYNNVKKKSNK